MSIRSQNGRASPYWATVVLRVIECSSPYTCPAHAEHRLYDSGDRVPRSEAVMPACTISPVTNWTFVTLPPIG